MQSSPNRSLAGIWKEHLGAPFPNELYDDPGGTDVVEIDATIAGCARSVLEHGGFADTNHGEILRRCLDNLRTVAPLLRTDDARAYCERLLALGRATQQAAQGR